MSRSGESDKKEAESGGGAGARQGSRSIGSNTDCAGGEPYYRYRDGGEFAFMSTINGHALITVVNNISRVLTILYIRRKPLLVHSFFLKAAF